jgi:hypothetical protein
LGPGIVVVPVPMLEVEDILAVDTSVVWFIERERLSIEISPYADDAWVTDSASMRVKLRAAVAAPMPAKSLRKLTIENRQVLTQEGEGTGSARVTSRGNPAAPGKGDK